MEYTSTLATILNTYSGVSGEGLVYDKDTAKKFNSFLVMPSGHDINKWNDYIDGLGSSGALVLIKKDVEDWGVVDGKMIVNVYSHYEGENGELSSSHYQTTFENITFTNIHGEETTFAIRSLSVDKDSPLYINDLSKFRN